MNPACILSRTGAFLVALGVASSAQAQPSCAITSGQQRAALVELYTSEGCSSCPPADRQLSLIGSPANTNVVALALHVNFWDYIGWKDPFARAEFTDRQRWLIGVNGSRTLYTPHFFVSGQEIQDRARVGAAIRLVSQKPAMARIRLEANHRGAGKLEIRAEASDAAAADTPLALHVAVTESGLSTHVEAGENRGARLSHDHVVRHWLKPVQVKEGGAQLAQVVGVSPDQARKGVNVLAFVQNIRTGEVLQAVSTGACRAA